MGIFSTLSNTIQAVCQPVIRAANAADESLDMATTYVHHRSVAFKDTDMLAVATDHAKRQAEMKKELEGDEDAAEIFNSLIEKMKA